MSNKLASMTYCGCQILIILPDPNKNNQIEVILYAPDGSFCGQWQFNAESDDSNHWILEGLTSAFYKMKSLGYLT
jgi:hypothetical protein